MRKIVLSILLAGVGAFGWNSLEKSKPDWFLKFVAINPLFDTAVGIDFNVSKNWTEENLQDEFDGLYFVCANEPSEMGDRTCWTYISKFNGVPANVIAFFFKSEKYHGLRVSFDAVYHNEMKRGIDQGYRFIGESPGSKEMFGQELGVWYSSSGYISAFIDRPLSSGETLTTWLRR